MPNLPTATPAGHRARASCRGPSKRFYEAIGDVLVPQGLRQGNVRIRALPVALALVELTRRSTLGWKRPPYAEGLDRGEHPRRDLFLRMDGRSASASWAERSSPSSKPRRKGWPAETAVSCFWPRADSQAEQADTASEMRDYWKGQWRDADRAQAESRAGPSSFTNNSSSDLRNSLNVSCRGQAANANRLCWGARLRLQRNARGGACKTGWMAHWEATSCAPGRLYDRYLCWGNGSGAACLEAA